jgi:hypothetical protein
MSCSVSSSSSSLSLLSLSALALETLFLTKKFSTQEKHTYRRPRNMLASCSPHVLWPQYEMFFYPNQHLVLNSGNLNLNGLQLSWHGPLYIVNDVIFLRICYHYCYIFLTLQNKITYGYVIHQSVASNCDELDSYIDCWKTELSLNKCGNSMENSPFKKLTVAQLVTNFPAFYEAQSSLPCLQQPTTGPYHEPL